MLKGKTILLGVTGGIAAYKSASLASLLVKSGAQVHVLMTENAKNLSIRLHLKHSPDTNVFPIPLTEGLNFK